MNLTRCLLILLCLPTSLFSSEPWADPKLTVKDGLELWLDASRASGEQKLADTVRITKWLDASGRGRHLTQTIADAQPARLRAGNLAVVRFDGLDDCLRAVQQKTSLEQFSIVLVAAPRANRSAFTGLLAFNAAGQRDYQSGLNLDFGAKATPSLSVINSEGKGFIGAGNLRTKSSPFGQLETLELTADRETVRLAVNGQAEGSRKRTSAAISLDEVTLGARFVNSGPGEQVPIGHCRCDIAEVLVYDRVLTAEELTAVRAYLAAKYEALRTSLPPDAGDHGEALVPVKDPPAVQVFVPGFSVRELPLQLTNINNVKYRADGTLVAMGYNGNIWHLGDKDGDGLPDAAKLFYENKGSLQSPIGMDLTLPDDRRGSGVYVASKGKVALILDKDNDGVADEEIAVATGWKEFSVNIDVLGVAVDPKDGSVWFGRAVADYRDAYLLGKEGKSKYSLTDERGTIQRVAPDFKSREIIATGIRVPVSLRFHANGDLFCSDQEGATWLPNGNPLDELLLIQKGKHYGFPPRHPKHLPNVIDEPSVFDYGPQHQSTTGFNFNEPVKPGGPTFGPKAWAGDAFITGYSRGKLYRTKLVKTDNGYVARNDLFACLNMLTADVCVTPDGGLIVACHSGGPDWGSGPNGKGKLYKITYSEPDLPQPVLAWPSGSREVRIAFDKPLDPSTLRDSQRQIKITAGRTVRAGDRFESLWPGYAVVQAEKLTPRYDVPVRSVQLTPDRRTLVLAVDPMTAAVHYGVTLPGLGRKDTHPQIDLAFDLSGCIATWTGKNTAWTGWLPSPDLAVSKALTAGSAEHDALWARTKNPSTLRIQGRLNLANMLRPAVQPGSRLDHDVPHEAITVSNGRVDETRVVDPVRFSTAPIDWQLPGDAKPPRWWSLEDMKPRTFALHRFTVPWALSSQNVKTLAAAPAPELSGGSWGRGRKVFFSDQAACAKCHRVHGQGEAFGPDLSNLIHRDYASVLRDIETPSFALNPDHLTYAVTLTDGRTLTGVMTASGKKIRLADAKGIAVEFEKSDIETMKASSLSTMPEGLPKELGPQRMKDLLTFLLTNPVSMPRDYPGSGPKPRTLAEVNAVLAGAPPAGKVKPLRLVLVAGPKDHGPGEHDYPAWQKAWAELLGAADQCEVATAWEWPAAEEFAKADAMIFHQRGDWNAKRAAQIDAYLERGGGLVYIHWAVDGRKEGPDFAKRIGLAAGGVVSYRHGELALSMNAAAKHPVLRNFDKLTLTDESYWKMAGDLKPERVLATAVEEKQVWPQVWSLEPGAGRVFV